MMVEQANLKDLEKSLYTKFQEDGIWDLMLGLFFLSFGLLMEFSDTTYIGFFGGLSGSFIYVMKRKITRPRLGYVKFSIKNLKKHRSSYISLSIVIIIITIIGITLYFKNYPTSYSSEFFAVEHKIIGILVISLIMAATALMFSIKRFMWYAVMLMFLFSLGCLVPIKSSYMLIVSGTIILINGVKLLSDFMKKYPKLDSLVENSEV